MRARRRPSVHRVRRVKKTGRRTGESRPGIGVERQAWGTIWRGAAPEAGAGVDPAAGACRPRPSAVRLVRCAGEPRTHRQRGLSRRCRPAAHLHAVRQRAPGRRARCRRQADVGAAPQERTVLRQHHVLQSRERVQARCGQIPEAVRPRYPQAPGRPAARRTERHHARRRGRTAHHRGDDRHRTGALGGGPDPSSPSGRRGVHSSSGGLATTAPRCRFLPSKPSLRYG